MRLLFKGFSFCWGALLFCIFMIGCRSVDQIRVIDEEGYAIEGAAVEFFGNSKIANNHNLLGVTDENGIFRHDFDLGVDYQIVVLKKDYETARISDRGRFWNSDNWSHEDGSIVVVLPRIPHGTAEEDTKKASRLDL